MNRFQDKKLAINHQMKWKIYAIGILIFALGVAITMKSSLGVSPVSSVPYILSKTSGLSVGRITATLFIGFIVLQILILRKDYQIKDLLQLVFALLFGVFVDFFMQLMAPLNVEGLTGKLVLLVLGTLFISIGILLLIKANIVLSPGDGLVKALAIKSGIEFHRVKIGFDGFCAILSATISLVYFNTLDGVGIGTIIGALGVGTAIRWLDMLMGKSVDKLLSTGS